MTKKKLVKQANTSKEFFKDNPVRKFFSSKIVNYVLWGLLIFWMGMCVTDFIRTKQDNKPVFTFAKKTTLYVDGEVTRYTGLGYRVYVYERDSYRHVSFGPIWAQDQSEKK